MLFFLLCYLSIHHRLLQKKTLTVPLQAHTNTGNISLHYHTVITVATETGGGEGGSVAAVCARMKRRSLWWKRKTEQQQQQNIVDGWASENLGSRCPIDATAASVREHPGPPSLSPTSLRSLDDALNSLAETGLTPPFGGTRISSIRVLLSGFYRAPPHTDTVVPPQQSGFQSAT